MVELLKESIKRRFINKTTLILFLIIISLISALMFSDIIIAKVLPDFLEKTNINIQVDYPEVFLIPFEDQIKNDSKAEITVTQNGLSFEVKSIEALNSDEEIFIGNMILSYTNTLILGSEEVELNFTNLEKQGQNEDYLYILITGIYFMMLAYSTIVANEVVVEKATNVIELICTAVDIKVHYYSKIIIGSMTVFLQLVAIIPSFLLISFFRYNFDKGNGLFAILYRFNILDTRYESINTFIEQLDITGKTVGMFFLSLLFLLIGLMIIQVLAVLISCRVESVEEAGALQGPFYLVLLLVYYASIFFKASRQLNHGWGYLFSYFPLFSMLLMPMKIFNQIVSSQEILLSLLVSLSALGLLIYVGEKYYRRNILYKKGQKV